MDYLVRGKFVFTHNERYGSDGIIPDGAVYVSGANIVDVGKYKDLKKTYSTATVVGSPRFWVMPGFVNHSQPQFKSSAQKWHCARGIVLCRSYSFSVGNGQ
jgi:hypothetical protein